MSKRRHIYSVMLILCVTMLTNAVSWAFSGEVFAHVLDQEHSVLSLDPIAPIEGHLNAALKGDAHLDATAHLCLHAAGQYQPLFFTAPLLVPASTGMDALAIFVSAIIPDSVLDSPLHPPRNKPSI